MSEIFKNKPPKDLSCNGGCNNCRPCQIRGVNLSKQMRSSRCAIVVYFYISFLCIFSLFTNVRSHVVCSFCSGNMRATFMRSFPLIGGNATPNVGWLWPCISFSSRQPSNGAAPKLPGRKLVASGQTYICCCCLWKHVVLVIM